MTQIGIMIEGAAGLNWDNWANILKTAEETGYQSVFRADHFTNAQGPHMDALELWTSLTYAASHTEKIEFGPLVTPITFRHPAMNVQYAAAIDVLSNGRLIFGLGIGWQDREHEEFGIYFPKRKARYEMLVDTLEFAQRLLRIGDEFVSYEGKHYSLKETKLTMKSESGPPILIGGKGPNKTLPIVAKYADEWNINFVSHDEFTELNNLLTELIQKEGRKPEDVKRSLMMRLYYRKDQNQLNQELADAGLNKADLIERGFIVGTTQEITDQLGAWSERGVERFMLQWLDYTEAGMEDVAHLGQEILPHFHK